MEEVAPKPKKSLFSICQDYMLTGVLTVIPLVVTWFIVELVFDMLSGFGRPVVNRIAASIEPFSLSLAGVLRHPFFQYFLAIVLVLFMLVFIGWIATKVIGKRIISFFDNLMVRIPMVSTIYGSLKKLLNTLLQKPDSVQRVVLIDFPSDGKKAIGLVTKTFTDTDTGENMAVVFVPMSPNPTGGFLEIVPVSVLISTDWTIDEAMTFIISGGAVSPENMTVSQQQASPIKVKPEPEPSDYDRMYKREDDENKG